MTPANLDATLKRTKVTSLVSGIALLALLSSVGITFPTAIKLQDEVKSLQTEKTRLTAQKEELIKTSKVLADQVQSLNSQLADEDAHLAEINKASAIPRAREGWTYLGKIEDGKWEELTMDVNGNVAPLSLKGVTVVTSRTVFCRTSPPRLPEYKWGADGGMFLDGTQLTINDVIETKPGIWWAKVKKK